MLYIPEQGERFTERGLRDKFNVRSSGGIRPTIKNKAIILIKSYFAENQGGYKDEINEESGMITHIGEGEEDQSLERNNKSLAESKQKNYTLLYFEKLTPNELVFRHKAEYMSHSFEQQKNSKGKLRQVLVFNLKIIQ